MQNGMQEQGVTLDTRVYVSLAYSHVPLWLHFLQLMQYAGWRFAPLECVVASTKSGACAPAKMIQSAQANLHGFMQFSLPLTVAMR